MLPVEIHPIQDAIVLRARGSELLILSSHVAELKKLKSAGDFSRYFLHEALVNRPARKLFEAWLRKDGSLWARIYKTVQTIEPSQAKSDTTPAPKESTPVKKTTKQADSSSEQVTKTSKKADTAAKPSAKATSGEKTAHKTTDKTAAAKKEKVSPAKSETKKAAPKAAAKTAGKPAAKPAAKTAAKPAPKKSSKK